MAAHTPGKPVPTVVLASFHPCRSPQAIPLATAFIKAYADNCGCKIELTDFFAADSPQECADRLASTDCVAIGFSIYVWNREQCLATAQILRSTHPRIILFAGGPEATADTAGILANGVFDGVISGEGEQPCRELFNRLATGAPLADIAGFIIKDQPTPQGAPLADDLDSIPSPYLSGELDAASYQGILWQLSRGCGFACDFCFDARGSRNVRRFSLQRIEAELRHFAASGVSQIFVLDSTFNQDMKRAKAILRLIAKHAPQIHFHFEVRSEFIDQEMAELFAGIICSLQIGLQSADPAVLTAVGRTFRPDDFTARVGLLNDHGATFGFDLMYGLPGDTLQGFRRSLDFSLALYPNHLDIFPLAILPGTALAKRSRAEGLRHLAVPPYTLTASNTFSADEMAVASRLANACDIFYTRGRAVAWFNSVLDLLRVSPSDFLGEFAGWLQGKGLADLHEKDLDDPAIKALQLEFLAHKFGSKQLKRYLPLINDLVEYHFRYAVALLAEPCICVNPGLSGKTLAGMPLALSSSVQVAAFNYDLLEVLDSGAPDIRWLCANLQPCGSHAVIYPHDGMVCTEAIDAGYSAFLLELATSGDVRLAATAGKLPTGELHEFLEFAWNEGLIRNP